MPPILQDPIPLWGDGSDWGDGDLYYGSVEGGVYNYIAYTESLVKRVAVRIFHTVDAPAGVSDSFRIYSVRLAAMHRPQIEHTWEAYVDAVTPSERVAVQVTHIGGDLVLSNIRLKASHKRHQPKG